VSPRSVGRFRPGRKLSSPREASGRNVGECRASPCVCTACLRFKAMWTHTLLPKYLGVHIARKDSGASIGADGQLLGTHPPEALRGTRWFMDKSFFANSCRFCREGIHHNQEPHELLELMRGGERSRAGWPVRCVVEVGGERPGRMVGWPEPLAGTLCRHLMAVKNEACAG